MESIWNEEQTARISLTVHAPWWKTGVAYVIYIVLSIAIIAASIRLYIHRTRKEMERKHKEENPFAPHPQLDRAVQPL